MTSVFPVSLPLLEGLRSRPGSSETTVCSAVTRFEAGRRIARWMATIVSSRRMNKQAPSKPPTKRRKKEKQQSLKKKKLPLFYSTLVTSSIKTNDSHWILSSLNSPSLAVRQASLHIILKGTTTPTLKWKLSTALVAEINAKGASIPLVGLLSHFITEEETWNQPVVGQVDALLLSFCAAGGLRWLSQSIVKVVQQLSTNYTQELEAQLCLLVHFLYRCVLYATVPGPKSNKERSNSTSSEQDACSRRRRAFSVTSDKSCSSEILKELKECRAATLKRIQHYFWNCSGKNGSLSPLACLLAAYEVLATLPTRSKQSSLCLSMLKRLINPNSSPSVVTLEDGKKKTSTTAAASSSSQPQGQQQSDSSSALQEVAAPAGVPVDMEEDNEEANDVVMEDDDDEEEEEDEASNHETEDEEGGEDEDIDFVAEEEEHDDDDDEESLHAEEEEEGNDIDNVVRRFERRLMDISDSDTVHAEEDGPQQQESSCTTRDRGRALIQATMQVLATQHPAAGGASTTTKAFLNPAAEQALIQRICNVVKPPKKPLNVKMFMRRAPTQEEFFRGSLTRNPVPLSSLTESEAKEPTVRDLRKYVADDLQMSDSAELIELLVANRILDMDLKLRVVNQVLWKTYLMENSSAAFSSSLLAGSSGPSFFSTGSGLSMIFSSERSTRNITADTPASALPPMVVTYRLAGVDGEATEDHVSTLEDPDAPSASTSAEEQERVMEKEYGITGLVTEGRGIGILLRSIESDICDSLRRIRRDDVVRLSNQGGTTNASRQKFQQSPPCAGLTLLRHCTQLASNRKKLLEAQAPTILLRLLLDVLNALDEASSRAAAGLSQNDADEAHAVTNPTAALLQELIETLASDMSPELETALASSAGKLNDKTASDVEEDVEEAASTLPLLLSSLRTIYLGPPMRKVIAKLLPFLTYGQVTLSHELATNFVLHVKIDALGDLETSDKPTTRASVLMDTFVQATISIPPSEVCSSLRTELTNCGFVEQIVTFILEDIPSQPPPWSSALWSKNDSVSGSKRELLEKAWRSYFLRMGLRTGFQMLAGLCNRHEPTQSLIASIGTRKKKGENVPFLTACHWLEATSDNSSLCINTNGMGLLAETLLDELREGNDRVSKKVKELRNASRDRKKEIAKETRSKTLVSMSSYGPMAGDATAVENVEAASLPEEGVVGNVARRVGAASLFFGLFRDQAEGSSGPATRASKSPKKQPSKPAWLAEMEAMEDETGLTCAVCQEGRKSQPSQLLGLYAYVKKVTISYNKCGGRGNMDGAILLGSLPSSLPDSLVNTNVDHEWYQPARLAAEAIKNSSHTSSCASSSAQARRSTQLTTTVSAGNAIHCGCHAKARSADRNHPRAPKSEWEGASLRNSRVNCNAILPLVTSKSSKVSLVAVDMALTDHQAILANTLGQRPKSMLWSVLHDVRLLLLRMAYGEALNADCGGGSLSSNSALLFYQLFMADMFANDDAHGSPGSAQHARFLSAGFLAAINILRANDFDSGVSSNATNMQRGVADAAPMAAICCILFHNTSDEDPITDKESKPHPRRRWALHKDEFLRGLIACAGRRHALGAHDSGCISASRGSRTAARSRSSSFADWDMVDDEASSSDAPSRRKPHSSILGKRGLPQIDDFAKTLRPMITLYAILDQLSSDFVVNMCDEDVEAAATRLAGAAEMCQRSRSIHDLLQKAKVTLDHEEIIEELQKGMASA